MFRYRNVEKKGKKKLVHGENRVLLRVNGRGKTTEYTNTPGHPSFSVRLEMPPETTTWILHWLVAWDSDTHNHGDSCFIPLRLS